MQMVANDGSGVTLASFSRFDFTIARSTGVKQSTAQVTNGRWSRPIDGLASLQA